MNTLRILMLEDSPTDALVIQKILSRIPGQKEITLINSGKDYLDQLNQQNYDLILCDYKLPDFDGSQAVRARNNKNRDIPFILITGAVSEDVAVSILKEGADDYILKDRLQRLPFAIEKILRKQKIRNEKQSIEASLSELTERFQMAARTSFDVIWDFDLQKGLVYCSAAIEKIIGTDAKEHFELEELRHFIYPQDIPGIKRSFELVLKGKENRWRKIFRVIRNDGTIAWVNTNALFIRNEEETVTRVIGVMHDVTEIRRLQHLLTEQEIQNQKQIIEVAIQVQEKERMEIGKELHDNINQILATAKMMIDTARTSLEMHDLCLEKSREAIIEAISELRNLSHSMMPPSFENSSFEDVVNDLVYKINLAGNLNLELSLPPSGRLEQIASDLKLCLYRIIQEQVSNILKYAKARNVEIAIEIDEPGCSLTIEDDGVGFDVLKRKKGIGLKNIESRCSLFNGTFTLESAPGQGCKIIVQIPASEDAFS